VTPRQFYDGYLKKTAVDKQTLDDARARRDEIASKAKRAVAEQLGAMVKFIPAGALAAGTQIAPLNDVDTVLEAPFRLPTWIADPGRALRDVRRWVEPVIKANYELSSHANKLTFLDENFTADIVIGTTRTGGGLLIPHCPKDEPHEQGWIETHPAAHAQQLRDRNKAIGYEFAREIRMLKALNRQMGMRTDDGRKPLSSFHIAALALTLLRTNVDRATATPYYLAQAAQLVHKPLRDPAGAGADIEARNPVEASRLLQEAADITARALQVDDTEAEQLLNSLFGDPAKTITLISGGPVTGNRDGRLAVGAVGAAAARTVPPVRSHGDGGQRVA
jgi:hypothetical protein